MAHAQYDAAVSSYLSGVSAQEDAALPPAEMKFPARMLLPLVKISDLRYGENPHQDAAFYREESVGPYGVAGARQFHGKELSFNNILDLNAALSIAEFGVPAVVIKHSTPSEVSMADRLVDAYRRAYEANSLAAYGGIVGLSRTVDKQTAEAMAETFMEAIIVTTQ